jgi:chaperonin GroEL
LVGGYSKVEITEKKDRIEDAIAAVRAALDGGLLPGGGFALYQAAKHLDLCYLKSIITTPLMILMENSNVDVPDYVIINEWDGFDFKNKVHGDMYEMGIVDPFLVTKTALENAVSAASLILTNGCTILNME